MKENEPITIKPQVIETSLLLDGWTKSYQAYSIPIIIKSGEFENCISVGRRDIFFDKEGNCTGGGINPKET